MQSTIYKFIAIFILLFVASCSSHKGIIDGNIKQLQQNSVDSKLLEKLEVKESSKEYLLFNQELSRIHFISNNSDKSLIYSKKATDYYNHLDDQATINVGGLTSGFISSTVGSDNNLKYTGSDYERSFDYFYSAISYLRKNDIEKAMIDIRASADIQKLSTAKREEKIIKAQKEINSRKDYSLAGDAKSIISENNKILENTQKSFLNAYIYYISGNIRELYGDSNGAMVDYKIALSINPNNSYIQKDAMRLSRYIDSSYYQDLQKIYKDEDNYNYKQQATVIVVYEQGFVPKKEEIKASILGPDGSFYTISLPSYPNSKVIPSLVSVDLFSNGKIKTKKLEVISNTYDMARNDLAEDYPMILARQATRVISKSIMQNAGEKNKDSGLGLLLYGAGAVTSILESADTRSFRTLPHFVEVAKISSNTNIDKVKVSINFGKSVEFDDLKVNQGETVILYIIDTNNYIYKSIVYQSKKL